MILNAVNYALCRDVGEPRDCHTQRSKSEREKQILDNITYMWNLEKCYRRDYLQSWNRGTDIENRCMDIGGIAG